MAIKGTTRHLDEDMDNELGWSAVVKANGMLYLAGIAAVDDEVGEAVAVGDPVGQVNYIYDHMEKVLALCGATLEHVVQEIVFTTDMSLMKDAYEARKKRYEQFKLPATAGCEVSALDTPGCVVEVIATAVDPEAQR
jgi:enamine deaminase RidA (YjgF/YER057c/UK114 family)